MEYQETLMINFLIYLRKQFYIAKSNNDGNLFTQLSHTFISLEHAGYDFPDEKLVEIATHFLYGIQDFYAGAEWKSTIPSEEEIIALFPPHEEPRTCD